MRPSKPSLIMVLLLASAAAAITLYFSKHENRDSPKAAQSYKEVQVGYGTLQVMVTAGGVVRPIDRIELKSKASGVVEELPVEEGDFVRKGNLIARLDQKDERTELTRAEADLDIARADLKQAQRDYKRKDDLYRKGLISEDELDQSELNLTVARGKLVQASTALDRARERLSESVILAPIDGVILKKSVEKGQIIASGVTNVSGGTPIADIADMRLVHVEAGVDEVDIGKIEVGQAAAVVADAYPDLQFQGKVVRIAPEAKIEQNVTLFNVIVEVENRDGKLKSGMNSTMRIIIAKKENVLLAPAFALQAVSDPEAGPDERMVLLKQEGEFVPRKVKIGQSDFKEAEIVSGVSEGNILGVPMTSRLKDENEQMEERIRSSRSFGVTKKEGTP